METRGKGCDLGKVLRKRGSDTAEKGGWAKSLDFRGKGIKKGLTDVAKRGRIISTLADTHINP